MPKKQVPHQDALNALLQVGLVERLECPDGESYIALVGRSLSNRRRAVLLAESLVLEQVRAQLSNLSIVSPGVTQSRGTPMPCFGAFNFDLVGPTYLSCFAGKQERKRGNAFVVGDVIFDRTLGLDDVHPFLSKCNALWGQGRKKSFIGVIVGDLFQPDCFTKLRSLGLIPATTAALFGQEVSEQLRQLIRTMANAAEAVVSDPEAVFRLMASISKMEGASLNLPSWLLELIVARLFSLDGHRIDIRYTVTGDAGKRAEIDVKAVSERECVCVECKAMAPGNLVDEAMIRDWESRTLPRVNEWLKRQASLPNNQRHEFIASTGYTPEAAALIEELKSKHKRRPIEFLQRADMLERLKDQNQSSLTQAFREHFGEQRL